MGKGNKVVLIRGNKNQWYEQAIFIVRSEVESMDFVKEAERIVNAYLDGEPVNKISPVSVASQRVKGTKNEQSQARLASRLNRWVGFCIILFFLLCTYAYFI